MPARARAPASPGPTRSLSPPAVLQVMALRGENASAKSLHSVVQSLESDKVKLELKVKNLELQLKENRRQLSSSSGRTLPERHSCPPPHTHPLALLPAEGPFLARTESGQHAAPPGPSVPGSPAAAPTRAGDEAQGRAGHPTLGLLVVWAVGRNETAEAAAASVRLGVPGCTGEGEQRWSRPFKSGWRGQLSLRGREPPPQEREPPWGSGQRRAGPSGVRVGDRSSQSHRK